MATNDLASLPDGGGNPDPMAEMPMEQGRCIKLYLGPDGSMSVSESAEPAPEDGQPVASIEEALEAIRTMAEGEAPNPAAEDAMASARKGYDRMAPKKMGGGMPVGAVFGEG
jgi:hypothetical protein